jgi:hypothetical protein
LASEITGEKPVKDGMADWNKEFSQPAKPGRQGNRTTSLQHSGLCMSLIENSRTALCCAACGIPVAAIGPYEEHEMDEAAEEAWEKFQDQEWKRCNCTEEEVPPISI